MVRVGGWVGVGGRREGGEQESGGKTVGGVEAERVKGEGEKAGGRCFGFLRKDDFQLALNEPMSKTNISPIPAPVFTNWKINPSKTTATC